VSRTEVPRLSLNAEKTTAVEGAGATIGHRVDFGATPENASPLDIAVPLLEPRRRAKTRAIGLEKRLRPVVPFPGNRVGPFPGNRVVPFLGNQGGPITGNPAAARKANTFMIPEARRCAVPAMPLFAAYFAICQINRRYFQALESRENSYRQKYRQKVSLEDENSRLLRSTNPCSSRACAWRR